MEIKKAIQKQVLNVTQKTARDLFEPLSMLMRQLLQDDSAEIYLETLNAQQSLTQAIRLS